MIPTTSSRSGRDCSRITAESVSNSTFSLSSIFSALLSAFFGGSGFGGGGGSGFGSGFGGGGGGGAAHSYAGAAQLDVGAQIFPVFGVAHAAANTTARVSS